MLRNACDANDKKQEKCTQNVALNGVP
jgi:hypothetical protein